MEGLFASREGKKCTSKQLRFLFAISLKRAEELLRVCAEQGMAARHGSARDLRLLIVKACSADCEVGDVVYQNDVELLKDSIGRAAINHDDGSVFIRSEGYDE